jgi:hypothetical protein
MGSNAVMAWLKPGGRRKSRLQERRDPIVLPEHAHIQMVIDAAPGMFAEMVRAAVKTGARQLPEGGARRRSAGPKTGPRFQAIHLPPPAPPRSRGLAEKRQFHLCFAEAARPHQHQDGRDVPSVFDAGGGSDRDAWKWWRRTRNRNKSSGFNWRKTLKTSKLVGSNAHHQKSAHGCCKPKVGGSIPSAGTSF